ncbi:MAG: L-seryl-tRNA(Sec) selenium transferase [Acidimicrobiales bacterium]
MTRPPSVDRLARAVADDALPHPLAVEIARAAIADDRVGEVAALAAERKRRMLTPVVNATGVLLHTNLGRAPVEYEQAAGYTNLELDLATGRRGSRQRAVGDLLATLCGAEEAMVVNNGAAAVLLALAALAGPGTTAGTGPSSGCGTVLVSRGELVEIGGGFRIPDVMAQSGAGLTEVGTTNRTRLADYRRAASADPTVTTVLSVHRSNYDIVGFTESTSVAELASLGLDVVVDLGSGLIDRSCPWIPGPPPAWLDDEPAVRQTLDSGADLVIFSGDKLLGGPQAGILVGRRDLIERCGRHPLARAMRPGGLVLGALQAVSLAYLRRDGQAIPFWRMATAPVDGLRARAEEIVARAPSGLTVSVTDTEAVCGGGTLPRATIPSAGLRLSGNRLDGLRSGRPPVVGRIADGATVLDLRTVDPADDPVVVAALADLATAGPGTAR